MHMPNATALEPEFPGSSFGFIQSPCIFWLLVKGLLALETGLWFHKVLKYKLKVYKMQSPFNY